MNDQPLLAREVYKQLVPADGWYAVFVRDDWDAEDMNTEPYYVEPLALWALWESMDGRSFVQGLLPEGPHIRDASDRDFFYEFIHKDAITEEIRMNWLREARRKSDRARAREMQENGHNPT